MLDTIALTTFCSLGGGVILYKIIAKVKDSTISRLVHNIFPVFVNQQPISYAVFRTDDAIDFFRENAAIADRPIVKGVIYREHATNTLTLSLLDKQNQLARNSSGEFIGRKIIFGALEPRLEQALEKADVAIIPIEEFPPLSNLTQSPSQILKPVLEQVFTNLRPHQQDVLTYQDAISFFVKEKPDYSIKQGAMRLKRDKSGFVFQQAFLDDANEIIRSAKSRHLFVRHVDPELLALFRENEVALVR